MMFYPPSCCFSLFSGSLMAQKPTNTTLWANVTIELLIMDIIAYQTCVLGPVLP
jgi:hypothetical protein